MVFLVLSGLLVRIKVPQVLFVQNVVPLYTFKSKINKNSQKIAESREKFPIVGQNSLKPLKMDLKDLFDRLLSLLNH
jgi:hypothetical protein